MVYVSNLWITPTVVDTAVHGVFEEAQQDGLVLSIS